MVPFPWSRQPHTVPSASEPHAAGSPADTLRWQALLQTMDDGVLLVSQGGQVLLSNLVADRLFAPQALPTDTDSAGVAGTLLARTLSSELNAAFQDAVRRHACVETEVTLGQPVPRILYARVAPISPGEFLIVLDDLTELRRLERVRRDFVANVSHELRTPLASVKAMAETLLDGAVQDGAVATRFLETIIRESDRLVRLSTDLLDLSQVETRGLEKTPVDLAPLVAEVAGRLAGQAQKVGLILTNLVRSPLIVPADRDEMAQVLVNLLDNAIAYTPSGGTVTIAAHETSATVEVSVADTGIGILSHDIPRLFERFYRADKARSRASGGTGLGLAIVKHIVESHGGTVRVESEYNQGSVFTVVLPRT